MVLWSKGNLKRTSWHYRWTCAQSVHLYLHQSERMAQLLCKGSLVSGWNKSWGGHQTTFTTFELRQHILTYLSTWCLFLPSIQPQKKHENQLWKHPSNLRTEHGILHPSNSPPGPFKSIRRSTLLQVGWLEMELAWPSNNLLERSERWSKLRIEMCSHVATVTQVTVP